MKSQFEEKALQETYKEMELLVYDTVHKFRRRYGGDFEELNSEANLIFMKACSTYNPEKGQFSTWLVFLLRNGLIDNLKKRIKDSQHVTYGDIDEHRQDGSHQNHFLINLKDQLKEESKDVLSLILDMPKDLEAMTLLRGGHPSNLRSSLRDYLLEYGWTVNQIKNSFLDIKKALHI